MNIKRAIISVYNKEGLEKFAGFLFNNGVEIISTGGTADYLEEKGIKVTRMVDYTEYPEILNGKLKTIHPKLFAGVLCKVGDKEQEKEMKEQNIPLIDMVVVNFYPFADVSRITTKEDNLLKNIDIGGVSLIRAAAKNYRDVVPVVDPEDYDDVIESIQDCGDIALHHRRKLALKSFYRTSKFDSNIHKVFSELFASEKFEHEFFELWGMLRYGSNPLQEATLLKFAEKESFVDYIRNLTPHKSPTLRMMKDIKILFDLKSRTNEKFLAFSKKGVFVLGVVNPEKKDLEKFFSAIKKVGSGVVYTDSEDVAKKLKNENIDGILTSCDLKKDEFISSKPMIFCMKPKKIDLENEYFVDEDLVIKEEHKRVYLDLPVTEELAFEVAKMHKSDTIVYVKNNFIYSGIQSILNRELAIKLFEEIMGEFGEFVEEGTIIFDSPVKSNFVIEKIIERNISKVIVPPALPGNEKHIERLRESEINVIVTSRRYHKY